MLGPVFVFPVLRILNSLINFFVWRFTHKHSIFVCLLPSLLRWRMDENLTRAAEFHVEALFKDPPAAKEDCPICFIPMPVQWLC